MQGGLQSISNTSTIKTQSNTVPVTVKIEAITSTRDESQTKTPSPKKESSAPGKENIPVPASQLVEWCSQHSLPFKNTTSTFSWRHSLPCKVEQSFFHLSLRRQVNICHAHWSVYIFWHDIKVNIHTISWWPVTRKGLIMWEKKSRVQVIIKMQNIDLKRYRYIDCIVMHNQSSAHVNSYSSIYIRFSFSCLLLFMSETSMKDFMMCLWFVNFVCQTYRPWMWDAAWNVSILSSTISFTRSKDDRGAETPSSS